MRKVPAPRAGYRCKPPEACTVLRGVRGQAGVRRLPPDPRVRLALQRAPLPRLRHDVAHLEHRAPRDPVRWGQPPAENEDHYIRILWKKDNRVVHSGDGP